MRRIGVLFLIGILASAGEDELKQKVEQECVEFTQSLEAYLGKKFQGPVPVTIKTQQELADYVRNLAKKMTPEGLMEIAQELAERLHQIPPGYDLLEKQIEMLKQQVAGLYDPDTNEFFVAAAMAKPGTPMFQITVAHELVHAYRDVDKDYWKRAVASVYADVDWTMGVQYLVEGDATLVGFAVGQAGKSGDPSALMTTLSQRADAMKQSMLAAAEMPPLNEFPLILRESLIAPYAVGMVFAARVFEKGGKEALDAAYDQPPRSTEQVLHPEKYLGPEVDEPTVFAGGDPTAALGEGWSLGIANVMGEFETRVQLTEKLGRELATQAAEGWDGSRYFFCRKEGAPSFIGMIWTWDSRRDAREFAVAWARWASRRDGGEAKIEIDADLPQDALTIQLQGFRVVTKDGLVVVRLKGSDVFVADGVPPDRAEEVFKALASATRTERKPDAHPSAAR